MEYEDSIRPYNNSMDIISDIDDAEYDMDSTYDEDAVMRYYNNKNARRDDDDSTISTGRKKRRKLLEDMKNADKGYNKITRMVNGKKYNVEVYSTGYTPGTMIRDAITGTRYREFRVGTLNEYQFFKVKVATGGMNTYSSTLFFDSPEQYERHMKAEVSQQMKEDWSKRCAEIRDIQYVPKNNSHFTLVK
jgi:hypothetical protein